jgi:hypothetical protein
MDDAALCSVLTPGGCLLIITYGEPAMRLPLLTDPQYGWHVHMYVTGKEAMRLAFLPTLAPLVYGPADVCNLVRGMTMCPVHCTCNAQCSALWLPCGAIC